MVDADARAGDNALGDFLRASRARVSPESAGLPGGRGRRVDGLRREEVAALAGVSVDYYVRLEQGRERRPSPQVIAALARVLGFDRDERLHLARLAGAMPPVAFGDARREVSPALRALIDAWPHSPAIVFDVAYDPLAHNPLGAALFAPFGSANLTLSVFLDPAAREFYTDWADTARSTAGSLRHAQARMPGDARVAEVIDILTASSAEFRALWADPFVVGKTVTTKRLRHPGVGPLVLTMQSFEVREAPEQELIVYQAEPGSPSDDALRLLGSMVASGR
jgi:transcriptional regulator with XRE-family HTH domain